MTGLLIKDIKLLQKQSRFFLLFVLCYGIFLIGGGPEYSLFLICYLTFVFTMFSISSFSYDEYDNCMAFLLSLPVERKDYVKEKYVFSILMSFGGWLLSILLLFVVVMIRRMQVDWTEYIGVSLIYLTGVWLFQSVSLPLIFRFGSEKGRICSFAVLGIFTGILFYFGKHGLFDNIKSGLGGLAYADGILELGIILTAVALAGLLISYHISGCFMKKRDF